VPKRICSARPDQRLRLNVHFVAGGRSAASLLEAQMPVAGIAVFELIRHHGALASVILCVFDLLELDGKDLRREPSEKRKALLAQLSQRGSIGRNK